MIGPGSGSPALLPRRPARESFAVTASPPHIALLTTALDVSGAERVMALLADGLAARGFRVTVAGLQRRSGALGQIIRNPAVSIFDVELTGAFDWGAIGRLRRWLQAERVNVLYTFLPHAHILGRYAARRAGTPHIISSQQVANWGGFVMQSLDQWTARWCDTIVAVSDGVREDLVTRAGVPADRVRVIFNAIDVATYQPQTSPFDLGGDRFVIGSASRLAPEKDHISLLRGMAIAVREIPELRLKLAGRGPLETHLRDEVARLGLNNYVELLGHVDDVRGFYDSLDVYVQPSRTEGLPCAVIEAMAMARPVIATDVPGNRDAVDPRATGWLIPARAPQAWVESLHQVRRDVSEARRRGLAGRRRAAELFDATPMVNETVRLLQELLQAG